MYVRKLSKLFVNVGTFRQTMNGHEADPFLANAIEDEAAEDAGEDAADEDVSMCCPTPPHLETPGQATSHGNMKYGKRGRPRKFATENAQPKKGATGKTQPFKKRTRCAGATQKLSAVKQESDVEFMQTIFLKPSAKKGARPAKVNKVPVTMWPQYSIDGIDHHRFVLVSASELWFEKMLKILRCRTDDQTLRRVTTNVMFQIKRLLRSILGKSLNCDDTEDVNDDEIHVEKKHKAAVTWSGFSLKDVLLLQKSWGMTKPTLVNTGEVMILLLDEEGTKFIREVIVEMIEQVALEAPDSKVGKKRNHVRGDLGV